MLKASVGGSARSLLCIPFSKRAYQKRELLTRSIAPTASELKFKYYSELMRKAMYFIGKAIYFPSKSQVKLD